MKIFHRKVECWAVVRLSVIKTKVAREELDSGKRISKPKKGASFSFDYDLLFSSEQEAVAAKEERVLAMDWDLVP